MDNKVKMLDSEKIWVKMMVGIQNCDEHEIARRVSIAEKFFDDSVKTMIVKNTDMSYTDYEIVYIPKSMTDVQ